MSGTDAPTSGTSAPQAAAMVGGSPLFIVSFRHRDELATAAARAGWHPIAARRGADAPRRFIQSGARVAVVDARGALDEGLSAVRELCDPAHANGAALLALVSRGDVGAVARLHDAGATHYLASPFGENELAQTLRFAVRHAERIGGGQRRGPVTPVEEGYGWSFDVAANALSLSMSLADRLGIAETIGPAGLLRALGRGDRRRALAAVRSLGDGASAAFSHAFGGERVAHHLGVDPASGLIRGTIESLAGGRTAAPLFTRDPLTGLLDGPAAREAIGRWLARVQPVTLILIGVARFDAINTAYGRQTGDALLRAGARRIERLAGDAGGRDAIAARVAGAEYLVALRDAGIERGRLVAGTLVGALARPFVVEGTMLTLGAHAGIAESADADRDAATLLRRASAALAEARMAEGEQIRVVRGDEADEVDARAALEADLREALAQGGVETLFQPQVSLADGRITGVEALARWRHSRLGTLGAETLFAAADRAGLGLALSSEVQARAMAEAAAWPDALAHLRLSINVTAADLAQPDFVERVLAAADAAGFPRRRLTVELTESGLIEDLAAAADMLARLRAAGCRVAVDDFGTGYSSLAYLKALPLDYLKLDRRLSEDIAGSTRDRVVVRGVIDMARSLGLAVVAEGVETEEQLALLAAEGCTLYQGFLCSPPVSSRELMGLVANPSSSSSRT